MHLTFNSVFKQVQGWTRCAPLSCLLLTQKKCTKPKHKEGDTPLSLEQPFPHVDSSASIKKSMELNQQLEPGTRSDTPVAALQKDAPEWTVLNAVSETMSNLLLGGSRKEEKMLRETPSQCRLAKFQKASHRPHNTVVPIKHFTFLPPIPMPCLSPQRAGRLQACTCKKASERETKEEISFTFDKKSGTKGSRVEAVINQELPAHAVGLASKFQICQHNPHFFSALNVSVPSRFQVTSSSNREAAHRTSILMGKRALHSGPAAGRMHPNKIMCAVNLHDRCEINV